MSTQDAVATAVASLGRNKLSELTPQEVEDVGLCAKVMKGDFVVGCAPHGFVAAVGRVFRLNGVDGMGGRQRDA